MIIAINGITGGYSDTGNAVAAMLAGRRSVNVHVHDVFARAGVVEDFWTFKHPAASEILRVGQFDHLIAKGPMREVFGGVASYITLTALVITRPILAKPIKGVAEFNDAATVRLHMFPALVRPQLSRTNRLRASQSAASHEQQTSRN